MLMLVSLRNVIMLQYFSLYVEIYKPALLEKKGSLGFYICSKGFFTQLQRTFYAKKGSIMTRKNLFCTKVLYGLLFIHVLHYSATFCCCN